VDKRRCIYAALAVCLGRLLASSDILSKACREKDVKDTRAIISHAILQFTTEPYRATRVILSSSSALIVMTALPL
jgi:hypothetical protein